MRRILLILFGTTFRRPLEVGKYYKQTDCLCIYKVTRITDRGTYRAFGRDWSGQWIKEGFFGVTDSKSALWYEITEKQFIEEVKKEAIRRDASGNYPSRGGDSIDRNSDNWNWSGSRLFSRAFGCGGVLIYSYGDFTVGK
jgi:hypothetical protein